MSGKRTSGVVAPTAPSRKPTEAPVYAASTPGCGTTREGDGTCGSVYGTAPSVCGIRRYGYATWASVYGTSRYCYGTSRSIAVP